MSRKESAGAQSSAHAKSTATGSASETRNDASGEATVKNMATEKFRNIGKQMTMATKTIDSFAKSNINKIGSKLGVARSHDSDGADISGHIQSETNVASPSTSQSELSPSPDDEHRPRRKSGEPLKSLGETMSRAAKSTKIKFHAIGHEIKDEFHKIAEKANATVHGVATGLELGPRIEDQDSSSAHKPSEVQESQTEYESSNTVRPKMMRRVSDVLEIDKSSDDIMLYDPESVEYVSKITNIERIFESASPQVEVVHIAPNGELYMKQGSTELSQPAKNISIVAAKTWIQKKVLQNNFPHHDSREISYDHNGTSPVIHSVYCAADDVDNCV